MSKNGFQPDWTEAAPKAGSVRSILKWGDPNDWKHPSAKLYEYMKDSFAMTDEDFEKKRNEGNESVDLGGRPVNLAAEHIVALGKIVSPENVSTTDYDRLKYSYGKTQEEIYEMRQNKIKEVADAVVHPRDKEDVKEIVLYCNDHNIPVYTYGGGSSVNFGYRPVCGGISLVLCTHMNKIVKVNEENKTCTVQPGMLGPAYEAALNNAKDLFSTKKNYTCGHFPQSFEYSSVGGWVAALGSGQESTYYGDAIDIVMAAEFVSPAGTFKTLEYPGTATGPKILDILAGSEGTYGIMTELTMKIFYHMPENNCGMGFIFKTWEDAIDACREISQGEFGLPGLMRAHDPEETEFGLKLYGVADTFIDKLMSFRGYKAERRSLVLIRTSGAKGYAKLVKKSVRTIARKYGAMYLTSYPLRTWAPSRYRDPYLREDLNDFGVILDTTESGITWDGLHKLHKDVRAYVKSRPNTACLTHASHFYPEGTNLYFIFFCKMEDLDEYVEFQNGVFDAIQKAGGSLSHHHGVGRMIGPWMEEHLGKGQMDVMRALKNHFDPNNIMNPGAQMGIDYDAGELQNHNWRLNWREKLNK